jgi:capsular polysaccharide biosynthesis protein
VVRELLMPRIKVNIDKAILLSTEGQNGYYHWLLDALPKLYGFNQSVLESSTLLLSEYKSKFIKESLDSMCIKNFVHASKGRTYKVKQLYVPELMSNVGNPRIEAIDFLRSKLIKKNIDIHGKKIFISRAKAKKRRINNEDELISFLETLEFTSYELENLSFNSQVKLFQESKFIIASHGAGLSNIIFSKKNTEIIELFPSNYFEECYQNISKKLGFKHVVLIQDNGDKNNNYRVNIEDLKEEIKKMGVE